MREAWWDRTAGRLGRVIGLNDIAARMGCGEIEPQGGLGGGDVGFDHRAAWMVVRKDSTAGRGGRRCGRNPPQGKVDGGVVGLDRRAKWTVVWSDSTAGREVVWWYQTTGRQLWCVVGFDRRAKWPVVWMDWTANCIGPHGRASRMMVWWNLTARQGKPWCGGLVPHGGVSVGVVGLNHIAWQQWCGGVVPQVGGVVAWWDWTAGGVVDELEAGRGIFSDLKVNKHLVLKRTQRRDACVD